MCLRVIGARAQEYKHDNTLAALGYGHIAPVSRVGRIATIAYACIGIPLLLMVLADLGKLFTRSVKYVLKTIRSIVYAKRLKGVRRAGRRATLAQQVRAYLIC